MPFDAYHQWLEIPPGDRPPDAYALLGIARFEPNAQVIRDATQTRIGFVRARAEWDQLAESRHVISELLSAQSTLLDGERKQAYDASLQTPRQAKTTKNVVDSVTTLSLDEILPLEAIKNANATNANTTLSLDSPPQPARSNYSGEQPRPTLSLDAEPKSQSVELDDRPIESRRAAVTMSLPESENPTASAAPAASDLTPKIQVSSDDASVADEDENQDRHVLSVIAYAAVALCICVVITLVAGQFREPDESRVADVSKSQANATSDVPAVSNQSVPTDTESNFPADAGNKTDIAKEAVKPVDDSKSKSVAANESAADLVANTNTPKAVQPLPIPIPPKVVPKPELQPLESKPVEAADAEIPPVAQKLPAAPELNLTSLQRDLPEFKAGGDRDDYVGHLSQMMYDGLGSGRNGLVLAEKSFDLARQLTQRDPRLFYAYALVLWKRLRFDEARNQLEAAIHTEETPYWPAWAALIRFHLARNRHETAFQHLIEMAEAARQAHVNSADPESVVETTKWIGRLVAYLEEPANAIFHQKKSLVALDDEIVASLDPTLRQHFLDSKQALHDDYAAAAQTTQQQLDEIESQKQERLKAIQAKVAQEKKDQEDASDQLNLSAENLKQRTDEQMQDFDQQLKEMSATYQELETEANGIGVSLRRLNQEIDNLFSNSYGRGSKRQVDVRNERLLGIKQSQRDQLQVRYRVLEKNAKDLRNQARTIMQKRQNTVDNYKKATGKLIEQSDELQKWSKVLDRRGKTNDRKAAARIRTLKRQAHALNTYLPFDLKEEKDRVLDSIRMK